MDALARRLCAGQGRLSIIRWCNTPHTNVGAASGLIDIRLSTINTACIRMPHGDLASHRQGQTNVRYAPIATKAVR
jgi:hypothetical protein